MSFLVYLLSSMSGVVSSLHLELLERLHDVLGLAGREHVIRLGAAHSNRLDLYLRPLCFLANRVNVYYIERLDFPVECGLHDIVLIFIPTEVKLSQALPTDVGIDRRCPTLSTK